jgi:hypothetical protein
MPDPTPQPDTADLDKFLYSIGGSPENVRSHKDSHGSFMQGMGQAALGVPEFIGQAAEAGIRQFKPDFKMPLHDWASRYRREAESTPQGIAGEVAGTAGMMAIPFLGEASGAVEGSQLARLAGLASRVGRATVSESAAPLRAAVPGIRGAEEAYSASPVLRQGLKSGAVAAASQPVDTKHAPEELAQRFGLGFTLGALAGRLGRIPRSEEVEPVFRGARGGRPAQWVRRATPEARAAQRELAQADEPTPRGSDAARLAARHAPFIVGHHMGMPLSLSYLIADYLQRLVRGVGAGGRGAQRGAAAAVRAAGYNPWSAGQAAGQVPQIPLEGEEPSPDVPQVR